MTTAYPVAANAIGLALEDIEAYKRWVLRRLQPYGEYYKQISIIRPRAPKFIKHLSRLTKRGEP